MGWMAPELFESDLNFSTRKYPFKSDLYSYAIACFEIFMRRLPYKKCHLSEERRSSQA
jgi:serine/threonine protein kinase